MNGGAAGDAIGPFAFEGACTGWHAEDCCDVADEPVEPERVGLAFGDEPVERSFVADQERLNNVDGLSARRALFASSERYLIAVTTSRPSNCTG